MHDDLLKITEFILEVDKLKLILRKNPITDQSRYENSAEHSWHAALMAVTLIDHASAKNLNLEKIVKMLLLHDIVEIDAGDVLCYDEKGYETKAAKEEAASKRIFGILPDGLKNEFVALWQEFDQGDNPEVNYAKAIDCLSAFLIHEHAKGKEWKRHGIKESQVLKRMDPVKRHIPGLWPMISQKIKDAVNSGSLFPG